MGKEGVGAAHVRTSQPVQKTKMSSPAPRLPLLNMDLAWDYYFYYYSMIQKTILKIY